MEIINERKVPRVLRIDFLFSSSALAAVWPLMPGGFRDTRTLSVAIFIHSSKFANMGTLFIGVTAVPVTLNPPPSSPFTGVCGLAPVSDLRRRMGVAADRMWDI